MGRRSRSLGRTRGARRWGVVFPLVVVFALVASACGDDDDDASDSSSPATAADSAASTASSGSEETPTSGPTETTADAGEPVQGGDLTILVASEARSLDSLKFSGFATEVGSRAFALYGALIVYDAPANEITPVLAESFESNADSTEWTITLRPGLTFTDGTAFDAAAIEDHWARAADSANASPAISTASTIASMEVVDELTLVATLTTPNALFDLAIAQSSLNYIGSPTAVAAGHDMATDPVAAGPFMVESYFRDDRLTLVRNPDWFDAPRPYLDSVTYRVVSDEQQRLDTFATGDANMLQSISIGFLDQAQEEGGEYVTVDVSSGQALLYNVVAPPFDDVRLRQAVALAVDRDVLAEIISGEGAVGATNFTPESSPWFSEEGALPSVDLEAAQALVDEAVADNGGPISFTLGGFQVSSGPLATEFIQTSLNQLDGLEVEVELLDAPTAISRVFAGDFQMWMFGQPFLDPEPSLYGYVHTDAGQNHASYSNATVDVALDDARQTADQAERQGLYATVFGELATDLPWMPILHPTQGVAFDSSVHGVELIWDGIVRFDLVWRD